MSVSADTLAVISAVSPKEPINKAYWKYQGKAPVWVTLGFPGSCWYHKDRKLSVISAVEVADDSPGPCYHLSISKNGKRCLRSEAEMVIRQFDMLGAEEDNHVPNGAVRNFFKPVAEHLIGIECPCKATEPKMVEDKGEFVWRG